VTFRLEQVEQAEQDDLQQEIQQLRQELRRVRRELLAERSRSGVLRRQIALVMSKVRSAEDRPPQGERPVGNKYVFDDEDAAMTAFDDFFATPDPHLDKVRGFLLD
jgi:DNA gyrase/topoisomerase IV subunit A